MKTVKKRSQKQEKSVAKQFNAKQVIASGSLWFADSDVRNDKFLIECKTTEKDYYSLTAKVWEKIEEEAIKDHDRIPLMAIDLEDRDRVIVFKPSYFSNTPQFVADFSTKDVKSFRIRHKDLGVDEFGDYTYMRSFTICGKKKNLLCYMKVEDFVEQFKEEL